MKLEQALSRTITDLAPDARIYLAYSGGLDSQVLLQLAHAFTRDAEIQLTALHLNHGLSPNAGQWQRFCARQCKALGIEFVCKQVDLSVLQSGSLEQHARNARYDWFTTLLGAQDVLLTAHHLDDQAETLVLRLLRASGTRGLASIPMRRPLGKGSLLRPLLHQSKADLRAYARQHGLEWVEDESNQSLDFDRNYIRHQVLPVLQQRWPGAAGQLARSAQHCRDDQSLLDDLAALDLEAVRAISADHRMTLGPVLNVSRFTRLPYARQRHLLQTILRNVSGRGIADSRMREWLRQLATLQEGRPLLSLDTLTLAVYERNMYLLKNIPDMSDCKVDWQPHEPLQIAELGASLSLCADGTELEPDATVTSIQMQAGDNLQVHWRRGGERVRPFATSGTRSLKKLLQAQRMPPWLREYLPLVSYQGRIIWSAALGEMSSGLIDAQGRRLKLCFSEYEQAELIY